MAVKPILEGYHTVTPYLVVPGVAGLIEFLQQAFGAEERHRMARPNGTIMHAEVQIGDSIVMMGEATGEFQPKPAMIHLYVTNVDATYRRALAAGATSVREPTNQFYGDRTGGVQDASGNQWWIATHVEDVPADEMKRRSEATVQSSSQGSESAPTPAADRPPVRTDRPASLCQRRGCVRHGVGAIRRLP